MPNFAIHKIVSFAKSKRSISAKSELKFLICSSELLSHCSPSAYRHKQTDNLYIFFNIYAPAYEDVNVR